jgi:glutathione S-transferase
MTLDPYLWRPDIPAAPPAASSLPPPDTATRPEGGALVKRTQKWTREEIVAAIQRFEQRYGRQPGASDFNPAAARAQGHVWRAERFAADQDYPHITSVRRTFGTWGAALEAAGFRPPFGRGGYERAPDGSGAHLAQERTAR